MHSSRCRVCTGDNVDLYIPRKCSWTNRLITAKDHASVQINIGHLDEQGIYNGQTTTFAVSGFVRSMASASDKRRRPSAHAGSGRFLSFEVLSSLLTYPSHSGRELATRDAEPAQ